jgi:hypothetical protein
LVLCIQICISLYFSLLLFLCITILISLYCSF